MGIPSRMEDRLLVLSKLKQTSYATILTDANLIAGKRIQPESAVFGQPGIKRWTSRPLSMTGHDYAIQTQEVERDVTESLYVTMDSWLAGWAAAFGMGAVTSAVLSGAAYGHTIKPMDPSSVGKDLPVTTIYTEAANVAGLARRLQSCCVKDFTLEFPASAPGRITVNLIGSGQIVTGVLATPPALAAYNVLMSNDMVFKYGTQTTPTDISAQIVAGSVKLTFSWNMDDKNSRAPGGGLYRSRAWLDSPDISLTFQRWVDDAVSTPNDDWLADTVQEVLFSVQGALIASTYYHSISVRGLAVIPTVVKLGQVGNKSIYEYTIQPDHWLKQGAADVITIVVQNTETSYLV
jgi:hypothetical protein